MGGEESARGRVICLALQVLVLARVGPSPADKRNQITAPKTGSKNGTQKWAILGIPSLFNIGGPKNQQKNGTEKRNKNDYKKRGWGRLWPTSATQKGAPLMRLWGYPCGAAGSLGDPPFVTPKGPGVGGNGIPGPLLMAIRN